MKNFIRSKKCKVLMLIIICLAGIVLTAAYYTASKLGFSSLPETFPDPSYSRFNDFKQLLTQGTTPEKQDAAEIPGTGSDQNQTSRDNNLKEQLRKEIETRYINQLQETALSYEGKLNTLIACGWSEYQASRNQGQKQSVLSLAKKYIGKGNALEAECDARFYAILNDFKSELVFNSLPTTTAEAAGKEYEKAKASRKRQLLVKALHL